MDETVREPEDVDGEAAAWLAAIDCGTADRIAFERWRAKSPAHALAFIRASQISDGLDLARESGVAEDSSPAAEDEPARAGRFSRRRLLHLGTAGVVALGAAGLGWTLSAAAQDVQTAVGERRRVVIGEGISLDLNTNSHVRWRVRDGSYQIQLLNGEVLLERQPGSAPCRLLCLDTQIEPATGRMNARLRQDAVEITVLQGDVKVRSGMASEPLRVSSLQRATLGRETLPSISSVTEVQAGAAEAWQRGELLFNGERLTDAVAEYNRYLQRPMVIADQSISGIRLGGRFSNSDPSEFLRALSVIYGVQAHQAADQIRLSRT